LDGALELAVELAASTASKRSEQSWRSEQSREAFTCSAWLRSCSATAAVKGNAEIVVDAAAGTGLAHPEHTEIVFDTATDTRGNAEAPSHQGHAIAVDTAADTGGNTEAPSMASDARTHRECSRIELQRAEVWRRLHEAVEEQISAHVMRSSRWRTLPAAVWRIFLVQNPIGAVLARSSLMPSSLRALFFMCDIIGGLTLTSVFFHTTTSVVGKKARGACVSEDPGEHMGRLLAIGTGSVLVCGLPGMFLSSLHVRGFKRFEHEGCPAWRKQLRSWRIKTGSYGPSVSRTVAAASSS